jgi:hypothetical protein
VSLLAIADLGFCEEDSAMTWSGNYPNPIEVLPLGTVQEIRTEVSRPRLALIVLEWLWWCQCMPGPVVEQYILSATVRLDLLLLFLAGYESMRSLPGTSCHMQPPHSASRMPRRPAPCSKVSVGALKHQN